jgi:glycosyltransferase involved in cell wall biosynthesis
MGLVRKLLGQGHEVIAIAPEDEFTSLLKEAGCRFFPIKMQNKGSNPFSDIRLFFQLLKIYKETRPDIVLHYTIKPNIYGTLAASLFKIPVINNVSGLGTPFIRNTWITKIVRMLYRVSFRFPRKIFFQNKDDRDLFLKNRLIEESKTEVLPGSGVDLNKFKPSSFKRNNPFVFLLIARILIDKGIVEYAEAIKILKARGYNARCLLMGAFDPGPLGVREELVGQWISEGLIEYIPFQSDVRSFIDQADCIVLPSYREGTPKTLLESASMQKPLIATDVPGCKEVIQDGVNGYLVQVKNPVDLADKMEKVLLSGDNVLEAMGRKSREMVLLKYDESIVISAYERAIAEVLGINQKSS